MSPGISPIGPIGPPPAGRPLPSNIDEINVAKAVLVRRACATAHHVSKHVHRYDYATDCFCGWREERQGYTSESFRNEGAALDFIEQTVKARIRRNWVKQSVLDLLDRGLQRLRKKLGAEIWD